MINEACYNAVFQDTTRLLKQPDFDYLAVVNRLEGLVNEGFGSLNTATNPAVINLPHWDEADLKFLVQEYSAFSNESIHMFHDATMRLEWDDVKREIARNLAEEMGELTNGIPHLELMRRGYREELGVETDDIECSLCTASFLERMRNIFRSDDNSFLGGALLAFEATATPEFKGVEAILRSLKARQGGEITPDSLTGRYISGHVADPLTPENHEDDHYRGMRDAIGQYIKHENAGRFIQGFVAVCTALNLWWEQLCIEVYSHKIFQLVEPGRRRSVISGNPTFSTSV